MSERVNRRTFLQASAVAATVAAGRSTSAETTGRVKLRKAVKYTMITGKASPRENLQMLADIGFEGVELQPGKHDVKEMIEASKTTGVKIHGLVGGNLWRIRLSDPDAQVRAKAVEYLKNALREAKTYGASTVLVIAGRVDKDTPYADVYKRSQEELAKAIPTAEELGIVMAIENVWNNFLLSPLEAARFVDELKSPQVRWYFDVGNVVRSGWPEHWIDVLGPRIIKLDIKEYDRKLQKEQGLWKGFTAEIGDAADGVEWPVVMKALARINFSGWATAEVKGGDRKRLTEIKAQMDRVLGG